MGLGAFPETHELSTKWFGMHGSAYGNLAVHNCDLLLAFGVRFDDRITGSVSTFAPQKLFQVNICTLCLPPMSNRLRSSNYAESRALGSVDYRFASARHHGKQTLRASGLINRKNQQRSKLRAINPIANQLISTARAVRLSRPLSCFASTTRRSA